MDTPLSLSEQALMKAEGLSSSEDALLQTFFPTQHGIQNCRKLLQYKAARLQEKRQEETQKQELLARISQQETEIRQLKATIQDILAVLGMKK